MKLMMNFMAACVCVVMGADLLADTRSTTNRSYDHYERNRFGASNGSAWTLPDDSPMQPRAVVPDEEDRSASTITRMEPADNVAYEIRRQITAYDPKNNVVIEQSANVITLRGAVESESERRLIEQHARSVALGKTIRNEMHVDPRAG